MQLIAAALLAVGMGQSYAAGGGGLTIPNTFTAGTPAVASQINDNFTAVKVAIDVLNSIKSVTYSAAAFTPALSTQTYSKVFSGNGALYNATGSFMAPLTIPAGSVITGMQASVYDGTNPGAVSVSISSTINLVPTPVVSVATLAQEKPGYITLVSPVLNHTVVAGPVDYYWLQVDMDSVSLEFYSVTISYR